MLEVYDPLDEQLSSCESDDFDGATARTSHVFSRAVPEPVSNRSVKDINSSMVIETENYGALVPFGKLRPVMNLPITVMILRQ